MTSVPGAAGFGVVSARQHGVSPWGKREGSVAALAFDPSVRARSEGNPSVRGAQVISRPLAWTAVVAWAASSPTSRRISVAKFIS